MSGSDIVLLVVFCVAFAVAVGIIIYNKVKGKSCCDDCGGCDKSKKNDTACNGHCAHCSACKASAENSETKNQ